MGYEPRFVREESGGIGGEGSYRPAAQHRRFERPVTMDEASGAPRAQSQQIVAGSTRPTAGSSPTSSLAAASLRGTERLSPFRSRAGDTFGRPSALGQARSADRVFPGSQPESFVAGSQPGNLVRRSRPGSFVPGSQVPNAPIQPSYARRAVPDDTGPPLAGSGGSLISALARAGTADEVVRVVLERSGDLSRASKGLSGDAQSLVQRIVRGAGESGAVRQGPAGPTTRLVTRYQSVDAPAGGSRRRAASTPALRGLRSPAPAASATTVDGLGASGLTKLAGKLMKLIHLAESQGRGEAQKQVRMSESDATRPDVGRGSPGGEHDLVKLYPKLLADVLQFVQVELQVLETEEDPNGW